jgi:TELO2-interacting protein 1
VQQDPAVLTTKHADYIFFPLSHVLRNQRSCPQILLERTVRVLTLLIYHGWKAKADPQLVHQLLLLLSFIIGGTPGQQNQDAGARTTAVSDEAKLEAFRALSALMNAASGSAQTAAALVEMSAIPAVSHGIGVTLDAITQDKSEEIQVQAMEALMGFFRAIKDDDAVASFLPGTVSSLVKRLKPARQKRRVFVAALKTLKMVLLRVLGDLRLRKVIAEADTQEKAQGLGGLMEGESMAPKASKETKDGQIFTPQWLKATASQIRIALGTVLKLREHEADGVRDTLEDLCISLLDECHRSLSNCADLLVETAIILYSEEEDRPITQVKLEDLVGIYPELADEVKKTTYHWVTSLPRVIAQSPDEVAKSQAMRNVVKGLTLVSKLHVDSSTLDDSVASALRDIVSEDLALSKPSRVLDEVSVMDLMSRPGGLVKGDDALQYKPFIMAHGTQLGTRSELLRLVSQVGSSSQQTKLASQMLDYARQSSGSKQVSSYWLAVELLRSSLARSADENQFFNFKIPDPHDAEETFYDLYSYSVSVVDSRTEASEVDWKLEAVALEVIALAASRAGRDFRPELIDVLYPITTFLGAEEPALRHHAVVTLNGLAASCGYKSVSDLIVDNVDYMVNSASIRLNTFDITPTSTKVLTMMIRLSGPRVVPFLDDVVGSIFAALDNYHGYPAFVDGLFGVLKEVVEQGVKSDQLLLEGPDAKKPDHRKKPRPETTMNDVIEAVERRKKRKLQNEAEDRVEDEKVGTGTAHPERPWGELEGEMDSRIRELADDDDSPAEEGSDKDPPSSRPEEEKPPKPSAYTLLSRIASLTQHYLTSPTPTLRKNLLDLLITVAPSLATDEDLFLPLVNAVWPTVINRLYHDAEPYITVAVCETLCILCKSAGDFLASRFKSEWPERLGKWCRGAKVEAQKAWGKSRREIEDGTSRASITKPVSGGLVMLQKSGRRGPLSGAVASSGSLGQFDQAAKVWAATRQLLIAIVSYVRVDDGLFEDVLELLADSLGVDKEAREALEVVNADAVWLKMYERGEVEWVPAPTVEGFEFKEMERFGKE